MAATVDLNSDMAESFGAYTIGDDQAMLDIVTSANIACGFHGGDPLVMRNAVTLAKEKGIAIGAHPSFLDLWGFGRRQILGDTPDEVGQFVLYQVGALQAVAAAAGHRVTHVKLHGALANMAQVDDELAVLLARRAALTAAVQDNKEVGGHAGQVGDQLLDRRLIRKRQITHRRERPAPGPPTRHRQRLPWSVGDPHQQLGRCDRAIEESPRRQQRTQPHAPEYLTRPPSPTRFGLVESRRAPNHAARHPSRPGSGG